MSDDGSDMQILDSHQHFWRIDAPGHQWPDTDWPTLYRDFLPADLRDAAAPLPLAGTILVQSQPDDRDTDWMLDLAAKDPMILGVVGWVGLDRADAPDRIGALAARNKMVGLRPMLQGIDDPDWILSDAVAPALQAMVNHRLRLDALIEPRHLPIIARLADRWPTLPIVIDHGAKPDAAHGAIDPWRDDLAALADWPHIWCKLSGLRTQQAPDQSADALAPYVRHILTSFGDRTMWGSDWPVLLHAGDSYADGVRDTLRLCGPLSIEERARLFRGAAHAFYGLTEKMA
ncbi:amidohydrolase family protein [Sphingobium aromaticiconvertens]|uniref:amidohydrolase family protein n=1 Tax=Sphingobium aromaticiconvertens TaxID=365341 RepID=UPI0030159085